MRALVLVAVLLAACGASGAPAPDIEAQHMTLKSKQPPSRARDKRELKDAIGRAKERLKQFDEDKPGNYEGH